MRCEACGRESMNPGAHFCDYCGNRLDNYDVILNQKPLSETEQAAPSEEVIPIMKWLGIMLLQFIPVIGQIIYIVILCRWGFGRNSFGNKKTWAVASLIYLVLSFLMAYRLMQSLGLMEVLSGMA